MVNVTEDGNITVVSWYQPSTAFKGIACMFLSASNIFLSIAAFLGNVLILVALHKVSSVHPPTKLLFRCLAVTDLCVGFIVQPLFAIHLLYIVSTIKLNIIFFYITYEADNVSSFILCGVSVLTSAAISVDRLLALLLGLRYRHVVTLRRVRAVIIFVWVICVAHGFIYLFSSNRIALTAVTVLVILSIIISVFSYTKIFLKLRGHHAHVQDHVHQAQQNEGEIPLNIARYKKMVSSIAWLQLALFACYVPFAIATIVGRHERAIDITLYSTRTLVYFNSSLNPALYCWKIREVK